MNRKQLIVALGQLAGTIPVAGPAVATLLQMVVDASDAELAELDLALVSLPTPEQIDAADARIYAEELAKKLRAGAA